jgi:hypothetical protein
VSRAIALLVAVLLVPSLLVGAAAYAERDDHGAHGLVRVHATRAEAVEERQAVGSSASASATWCGGPSRVDLAPNTVAGFPVHWIYATPSDGGDRFGAFFASAMQTDAEEIDAWWRREDPVRTPRNDLAQLPCGQQLDLT